MTNHVARLYALATALIVFFSVWLAVSAHPWSQASAASPAGDPQMAELKARERHLRAETRKVNLIVRRRYATYHRALARRHRANAAAQLQHNRQLTAARNAAVAARHVASAPSYQASAAPAPVRIVTLPPVASTRTS